MTDEEIIEGIRKGGHQQAAAVRALYARYRRPLMSFFLQWNVSPADAEDLLQDTVVKICLTATSYREQGTARAWIWTIARNVVIDHRRRKGLEDERQWDGDLLTDLDSIAVDDDPIPTDKLASDEVTDCVRKAIALFADYMPERALALTLGMQGRSISEVAEQLGRTCGATKEYLSQCKKKLRPFIEHCRPLIQDAP